jgi:hypothetical protein
MLGVLVFGIGAYNLLPVAAVPNVDFPTISVTAQYPGANPSTMASGYCAVTLIVGKSTLGTAATGSRLYAPMPNTRTPSISSEVPIGRRINGSEMLTGACPLCC